MERVTSKTVGRVHTHTHTQGDLSNKENNENGITLVALVVTIIVLIILAAVTINILIGNDGIITKAKEAGEGWETAQIDENKSLEGIFSEMISASWDMTKVDKVTSLDGRIVPVPKGYVASTVEEETNAATGFVIYEGTTEVNDGNVSTSRTTRNQYVWVPVPNINDMHEIQGGIKVGKLYDFGTLENPNNPAVLRGYPGLGAGFREPTAVTGAGGNGDGTGTGVNNDHISANLQAAGLSSSATAIDFFEQLKNEFDEMIKSVEKYGGFYIGRYETGDLNTDNPIVRKNALNLSDQTWYVQYNKNKKLSNGNDKVRTSMIWGSQWDSTLRWFLTSKDESVRSYITNPAGRANYSGTQGGGDAVIPAGSNEAYKVNNIYDMAGNVRDWTLEATSALSRAFRRRSI